MKRRVGESVGRPPVGSASFDGVIELESMARKVALLAVATAAMLSTFLVFRVDAAEGPASAPGTWKERVEKLEAQFEKAVEQEVGAARAKGLADLNKKYSAALDRAYAAATRAANLEDALAIREEKARVEKGEPLPAVDPDGTPGSLRRLRGIHRDTLAKVDADLANRVQTLYQTLDRALVKLEDEATRKGDVKGAAEIKMARGELTQRYGQTNGAAPPGSTAALPANETPVLGREALRQIVEWALLLDAEMRIGRGEMETTPRSLGDLPSGSFDIRSIIFPKTPETKKLGDEDLLRLSGVATLETFVLQEAAIKGPALKLFRSMPALVRLDLAGNPLQGAALADLAGHPAIRELELNRAILRDEDVAHLAGLAELRNLSIRHTGVTDACIEWLKSLPHLEYLNLGVNKLHGPGLVGLKELPALIRLAVDDARLTAEDVDTIIQLTRLESLEIGANALSQEAFGKLSKLTNLTYLGMGGGTIDGEWFRVLSPLKKLQFLRIWSGALSDADIKAIVETFPKLEKFYCENNGDAKATTAGLVELSRLRELTFLHLIELPVDAALVAALARLRSLDHLALSDTELSAGTLEGLRRARALRHLEIHSCKLDQPAVEVLTKLDDLTILDLKDSELPRDAFNELRRALPNASVTR